MEFGKLVVLAQQEMAAHGLTGWTFGFSNAQRRLGVCKYDSKRIEISAYYAMHSADELVIDTLRHEIAHALAGHEAGHGPHWKATAARIGARPQRCKSTDEVTVRPGDWQAVCAGCGITHHKYKKPKVLTGFRCRCPGRTPLTFAFAGDPKRLAPKQKPLPKTSHWQARCASCQFIHSRLTEPSAGQWLCRCPLRGELVWQFVPSESFHARLAQALRVEPSSVPR